MSEVRVMPSSRDLVHHTQYDVWPGYYGNDDCEFVQPHCSYHPMTSSTYYYSYKQQQQQQHYNCFRDKCYQNACDVTESKHDVIMSPASNASSDVTAYQCENGHVTESSSMTSSNRPASAAHDDVIMTSQSSATDSPPMSQVIYPWMKKTHASKWWYNVGPFPQVGLSLMLYRIITSKIVKWIVCYSSDRNRGVTVGLGLIALPILSQVFH